MVVVLSVLEIVFFSLAWKYFLKAVVVNVPLKKLLSYTWASVFIDLIIPAESISGEVSRIYFLSKYEAVDAGKTTASVVAQRILGMFTTMFLLALFGITINYPYNWLKSFVFSVVIITGVVICLLVLLSLRNSWIEKFVGLIQKLLQRIFRRKLEKWEKRIKKSITTFAKSIRFYQRPENLFLPISFNSVSWLFAIASYYLAFLSIGYIPSLSMIIVVYTLLLAIKVPVGISTELGVTEILMVTLFSAFGVPIAIGMAATILIRIVVVWLRVIIGLVFFSGFIKSFLIKRT